MQARIPLASAGVACLAAWAVSVTGATSWSASADWILLGAGLVLVVAASRA